MISDRQWLATIFILLLAGSACTPTTSSPTAQYSPLSAPPSPTSERCSPEDLSDSVHALDENMRQFDEYASLASVVLQSQVVKVLPPLQAIRRNVQSQSIPACLADLKRFELSYMDAVLQTLLAFQAPTPDAESLAAGILQARRYHDQYALELARVSGSTLTPPATTLPAAPTP